MAMFEIAVVIASACLGAMLFFSAAVAPTVFQALPEEDAGRFLRAVFPKYFLINGGLALLAGVIAYGSIEGVILAICGLTMLAVRYFAIPVINDARDAMLAGDESAGRKFAYWHRVTVLLNLGQILALVTAIALLLGR